MTVVDDGSNSSVTAGKVGTVDDLLQTVTLIFPSSGGNVDDVVEHQPPHRRWVSRDDAVAVYAGEWGSHRCRDYPCFRCVTLRWARKPKCSCIEVLARRKVSLGVDEGIWKRQLLCKCRPAHQVWTTFWCLCKKSPQWSRSGSCNLLIDDGEIAFSEELVEDFSESDVEIGSRTWRQRRRRTV
jgi:hypothetical protein